MMRGRLSGPPRVGDVIEPLGFGRCPLSTDGIHRILREGGPVERLSPGSAYASTSICPGDSGGPARSQTTGDVVGVVSAGVMDDGDPTRATTTVIRLDSLR